jgi:AraC family transcriptional regulator
LLIWIVGAAIAIQNARMPARFAVTEEVCLPSSREVRVSVRDRQRVASIVRHLEEAFCEPCSLTSLAQQVQLSPYYFLRMFKRVTGQSPAQYVINVRLRAAADELLSTQAAVADIAFNTGFNDLSHFYSSFRAAFGRSPVRWRQGVRP